MMHRPAATHEAEGQPIRWNSSSIQGREKLPWPLPWLAMGRSPPHHRMRRGRSLEPTPLHGAAW